MGWDNTVGRELRRCNRNWLWLSVLAISIGSPLAAVSWSNLQVAGNSKEWWDSAKMAFAGSGITCFGLCCVWVTWQRIEDIEKTPPVASLAHFGIPPSVIADHIEREISTDGNASPFRKTVLTNNWFLRSSLLEFDIMNLSELIWVYQRGAWTLWGFVPIRNTVLVLHDKYDREIVLQGSFDSRKRMLNILTERMPWILYGKSKANSELIKQDRTTLVGNIFFRRESYLKLQQDPVKQTQEVVSRTLTQGSGPNWLTLFAAVFCLIGLMSLPYGYYTFLRWIVCLSSALSAYRSEQSPAWRTTLICLSVIFNPFLPFHSSRLNWQIVDVLAAALFVWFSFKHLNFSFGEVKKSY